MKERPILFSGPMVRAILEGRKTMTRRVVKDPVGGGQFCVEYADNDPNLLVHVHNPKCEGFCEYVCDYPCPYGAPGDRLWVRETISQEVVPFEEMGGGGDYNYYWKKDGLVIYHADMNANSAKKEKHSVLKSRPSIHMPRWACRIILEVVSVRVERLQDISGKDAVAEGIELERWKSGNYPAIDMGLEWDEHLLRDRFKHLWDSINGKRKSSHISRRSAKGKPVDQYEGKHPDKDAVIPYSWVANPWVWVVEFQRVQQ